MGDLDAEEIGKGRLQIGVGIHSDGPQTDAHKAKARPMPRPHCLANLR
jgi:hypothetical protein